MYHFYQSANSITTCLCITLDNQKLHITYRSSYNSSFMVQQFKVALILENTEVSEANIGFIRNIIDSLVSYAI